MELSYFLAQVFGLMMLFIGLGMFIDKAYYEKIFKDFVDSPSELLTSGVLALAMGVALVTYHNIWDGEWWVVLITIFGWIALLKGFLRLLFPKMVMGMLKSIMKGHHMQSMAIVSVVLGLVLTYYGFLA